MARHIKKAKFGDDLSATIIDLLSRKGEMTLNDIQNSTVAKFNKRKILASIEGLIMAQKVSLVDKLVVPRCPVAQRLNTRIWNKAVLG